MKASKYNIYIENADKYYIYNQITQALSEFDEEFFFTLKNNLPFPDLDHSDKEVLKNSHFICDKDLQEENIILCKNRIQRYGNRIARITIMPTLDCNFRCWYCYESHIQSKMSKETTQSIILFAKKIIEQNKLSCFSLDWFGGEPLLYFNELVYPISKKIMNLCEQANIPFVHTITTNGYLITPDWIASIKEIKLSQFQITLDGMAKYHNKTRFSDTDQNTYDTIVKNVELLCKEIEDIDMTVRINYTPKNVSSMEQIALSFDEKVRNKIKITPQLVWQFKNKEWLNKMENVLNEKLNYFQEKGYKITNELAQVTGCYVENMLQFVINHDGLVYKCTARDFSNAKHCVGKLSDEGDFLPNANYYKYFTSSNFENSMCLDCNLLPSCLGSSCIQKKIEQIPPLCMKSDLYSSIVNRLLSAINK
ncbi:radical SAM/SPASM domain-containing protein [Bacteroidia bacterium]|nr:radical SAM/SPASM domain-containing protein [Bacteroidia bacterium]